MTGPELDKLHRWATDNYAKSRGFPLVAKLIEEYRKSEVARTIAEDRVRLLGKVKKTPAAVKVSVPTSGDR